MAKRCSCTVGSLLPASPCNPTPPLRKTIVVVRAENEKNFVGSGGMGNLPGLQAMGRGCCGGFADNGAGVFTGATSPTDYVGGGVSSVAGSGGIGGAGGIPLRVFGSGGIPLGRFAAAYSR